MDKIKSLTPVEIKFNWWILIKSAFFFLVSLILWVILFICSINLLIYYILLVYQQGFFYEETIKISIYLIIGTYFFLILDKKKVLEALGIKEKLPFITIEKMQYGRCDKN